MWYLVDMESGTIAVYNETHARYWSFFRSNDVRLQLERAGGHWVEVRNTPQGWEARAWEHG